MGRPLFFGQRPDNESIRSVERVYTRWASLKVWAGDVMKPYDLIEAAALLALMPFVAALVIVAAIACLIAAPMLILIGAVAAAIELVVERLGRA